MMKTRTRWICVALALGGAALMALAVQSGAWWSIAGQVEVRPMGSQWCIDGNCAAVSHDWLGGSALWERSGVATYMGALVAAFVLVIMASALAAGRRATLAASSALVAVLTAALAAGLFVALFPANDQATLGRSAFFLAGGAVAAATSILITLRQPAPAPNP